LGENNCQKNLYHKNGGRKALWVIEILNVLRPTHESKNFHSQIFTILIWKQLPSSLRKMMGMMVLNHCSRF
jgi:hypothetical protein